MKKIDVTRARWIFDEIRPLNNFSTKIANLIPASFEAYCKIFHQFEIASDESEAFEDNYKYDKWKEMLIHKDENGNLSYFTTNDRGEVINIVKHEEDNYEIWQNKERKYVSWRSIAEKYGLVFHNEITTQSYATKFKKIGWPSNLRFPEEGLLPQTELVKILNVVKRHSPKGNVFIYQKAPHSIYRNNLIEELMLCEVNEVLDYFSNGFRGYLYNEDKKWILYTDNDLCFTVVGANRNLINDLRRSELEVVECSQDTRVDNMADVINK